jgi:glycosyltransferase involved in cell wall biosynthesis
VGGGGGSDDVRVALAASPDPSSIVGHHIGWRARYAGGMPGELRSAPFRKLSVFFPMWNEEAYIERALDAASSECRSLLERGEILDYELIVVDDASTDHTGKMADEAAAADHHVRVVHHPVNRKLGGSMKTGFAAATGDLVLYSDADLPFDMAEVSQAIHLMRYYDADIVSAFRFDRTGEGSLRTVYTFFYNFLIRRLFGVRMRDINFAFKLCRTAVFDHISLHSEGSFIDAELIIRAKKLGFNVIQFGVDYFPRTRGESTRASGSVISKIVVEMLQLRRELRGIEPLRPPTA